MIHFRRGSLNVTGKTFGKLRVLGDAPVKQFKCGARQRRIVCECSCGEVKTLILSSVVNGVTRSCGCLSREMPNGKTHGKSNSRVYHSWYGMRTRCNNKNSVSYRDYGGRGIKVCKRWYKFENFYADMGDPPIGHTLDRIDNDGHYEPKNCRWSTVAQQNQNQRSNTRVTIDSQTLCLKLWLEKLGVKGYRVRYLMQKGYSPKNALLYLTQPRNKKRTNIRVRDDR